MKWLLLLLAIAVIALLATRNLWRGGPAHAPSPAAPAWRTAGCNAPAFREAAAANGRDFATVAWSPFGVAESGWDAYAPVIAADVGTACAPDSEGFAAALAAWQQGHSLPASGRIDAATFEKLRIAWMLRRPFVRATRDGTCPPGADEGRLAPAAKGEGYGGKAVLLDPGALDALRRMRTAARREVPEVTRDERLLTVVSGYRSPMENGVRCLMGGCGGPAKANCSAHRTGLAIDLYVGAAPGYDPTSSTDVNRSWQAATPLYVWLTRNAGRFGFVGYPYEPWHWEWAGGPRV